MNAPSKRYVASKSPNHKFEQSYLRQIIINNLHPPNHHRQALSNHSSRKYLVAWCFPHGVMGDGSIAIVVLT